MSIETDTFTEILRHKSYQFWLADMKNKFVENLKTILMRDSLSFLGFIIFLLSCKTNEPSNKASIEKTTEEISSEDSFVATKNVKTYSMPYKLGSRIVDLKFSEQGSGLTYVNLHDDENTSVLAVQRVLDSIGGRLIEFKHSGERNIQFNLGSIKYEFDPNRIFTDFGADESLKKHGQSSNRALKLVRGLAQRMVDSLDQKIIVTLHNNSDDNYSSLSYLDEYKSEAAAVFINPARDPDDFFFVTTRTLFRKFRALGFNTVLQNNNTMTDDGSLSVLAGRQKIPYINVEAQHEHLEMQIEMLFELVKTINNREDQ